MARPARPLRPARRARAGLLALACITALVLPQQALAGGDGGPGRLPTIRAEVGPGFTLAFADDSVPAGRYRLIVRDRSTAHNFHLTGAGTDRATSVPGTGKRVWRVTLVAGQTYVAVCDPHPVSMKDTLEVT